MSTSITLFADLRPDTKVIALETAIAARLVESSGWLCDICPGPPMQQ